MNAGILGFSLLAAAEDKKFEALELGLLLFLPLILSVVLLKIINGRIKKGGSPMLRWASLIPLLVGCYRSFTPFMKILDDNYVDYNMVSERSEMLHYAAFIVPCVAVLGMIAYFFYAMHRERMER